MKNLRKIYSKFEPASYLPLEFHFDSSIDLDCSEFSNTTFYDHSPVWVMVTFIVDDHQFFQNLVNFNISMDCELSENNFVFNQNTKTPKLFLSDEN